MKKEKNPIFIHSLFRTGSTYAWNKFRQNDQYYCYYEPFHQNLSKMTDDNIENLMTKDFGSVNHPSLTEYYLNEYKPLLKDGNSGLPYFKKAFSFDEFCNNDRNPDLKKYINNLIIGAGDKAPVLQFNRSALRVKWFKQHYPGSLNIYLVRHPRDQWESYFEVQRKTNYTIFFVMDLLTASLNKEKEYFKPLSLSLPLFEYHNSSYYKEENFYQVILDSYPNEEKYFIFYYIWLMALIENAWNADFILNMNLLSREPVYREKVIHFLTDCGITGIDLEDAGIKEYSSYQLSEEIMNKIEEKAHHLALQSIPKNQINHFFEKISTFDIKYFQFNKEEFLALKKKKFRAVGHLKSFEKLEQMIFLFSEKFFHQKEQKNILLPSLNQKEKIIAERNRKLALKDLKLSEKDEEMAEKEKRLAWKDLQLIKKDEQLARKDEVLKKKLNEKDKQLVERDKRLAWKDVQLIKEDEQLSQKDRELKQKLDKKDKQLVEKDKQLAWKDVQLSKKDEQLTQKDRELKQKLDKKDQQLAWKDVQLSKKDEQLTQKDRELKQKLDKKDQQLAWKDVQLIKKDEQLTQKDKERNQELSKKDKELTDKERQLFAKVKEIKLKEEYIQKIYHSYTYRISRILLFPFKKIKRLIRKTRG